jgi:hypothetical protein
MKLAGFLALARPGAVKYMLKKSVMEFRELWFSPIVRKVLALSDHRS